jgi:hypothetical protein
MNDSPKPRPTGASAQVAGQGGVDPRAQDRIGALLRQHFDDLVAAPVPDQLLVLLAELEAKEQALGQVPTIQEPTRDA